MRENPKVLNTKLNKEIYLMALVKNQRYSKNFRNIIWKIRRFKSKFDMIEYDKDLRDYVAIGQ